MMMMNNFKNITIAIMAVVILFLSLLLGFGKNNNTTNDVIKITDTIMQYHTPKTVIVKQPVPYFVVQTKTDTITKILTDTVLVKEYVIVYLTKIYYRDTAINDDTMQIVIDDVIFKNKIASRTVHYHSKLPTQIITNKTYTLPNYRWYIGISSTITTGPETKYLSLGPDLILSTPNRSIFRCGYDFINKTINFGYAWNINYKLNK
jgi:hypothetical protein